MSEYNVIDLQQQFEQMTTEDLEKLLRAETEKAIPNDDIVLTALHVLEARSADKPVELSPKAQTAWRMYQKRVRKRARKSQFSWRPLVTAATIILVIGLLFFVVPQEAKAESLWEKLTRWTAELVEFFGPKDNEGRIEEYEFKTDNPGLQKIYDTVVAQGITVPVVPEWIPEGYDLLECVVDELPAAKRLYCRLVSNENEIVFCIDVYTTEVSHEYQKDKSEIEIYEHGGVSHQILRNHEKIIAIWTQDNIECSVFIDCQEDTLYRILDSIYHMEEN